MYNKFATFYTTLLLTNLFSGSLSSVTDSITKLEAKAKMEELEHSLSGYVEAESLPENKFRIVQLMKWLSATRHHDEMRKSITFLLKVMCFVKVEERLAGSILVVIQNSQKDSWDKLSICLKIADLFDLYHRFFQIFPLPEEYLSTTDELRDRERELGEILDLLQTVSIHSTILTTLLTAF